MAPSISSSALSREQTADQLEKEDQERRAAVIKFITRKAAREELEKDAPPDFHSMTIAQLRMRLTTRGCSVTGVPTSEYANQLHYLWASWKMAYDTIKTDRRKEEFCQERTAMYARTDQMFASSYEADLARKSFLALPGEIRNMVYDFALFEAPEDDYASTEGWVIVVQGKRQRLQPHRSQAYLDCSSTKELRHDRTVSTVSMLAALNKQVRQEVSTFFWSRISITVDEVQGGIGAKYNMHLTRFLQTIGRDARAALTKVKMIGTSLEYDFGKGPFGILTQYLHQCRRLRELELCLPVENLFRYAPDMLALQAYILRGEALNSPSLNRLVSFLQAFPELRVLKLHTAPDRPSAMMSRRQKYTNDFLHFASTGSREKRLVQEIRKQLCVLEKVETEVISGREHIDDYEAWQKWQSGCRGQYGHK